MRLTNGIKLDVLRFHSRVTKLIFNISFNAGLLNQLIYVSASMHDIRLVGPLVLTSN